VNYLQQMETNVLKRCSWWTVCWVAGIACRCAACVASRTRRQQLIAASDTARQPRRTVDEHRPRHVSLPARATITDRPDIQQQQQQQPALAVVRPTVSQGYDLQLSRLNNDDDQSTTSSCQHQQTTLLW